MNTTNTNKLGWGIDHGHAVAFGARLILEHGNCAVVRNRVAFRGTPAQCRKLSTAIAAGPLNAALLAAAELRADDETEHVLYEDETVKIVGNPRGSYGYVYIGGWFVAGGAAQ